MSQHALDDPIALYEDAAIDDLLTKTIVVDVLPYGFVFGARLEPQGRNGQGLGLLEDA